MPHFPFLAFRQVFRVSESFVETVADQLGMTWVSINSLANSHKLVGALLSLLCKSILTVAVRQGHVQVVLPFKLPVSSATMAPSPTGPGPSKP